MTLIKICGIRETEHGLAAAESGASLIGFVFVPVRREVKPEVARSILDSVRAEHRRPPAAIGLFVNETTDVINRTIGEVGLDLVQLHGDELPEDAAEIDVPVIKALRLESGVHSEDVRDRIDVYLETCAGVLIDSHVSGHWGGTGVVGDWEVAASLAQHYPVALAGGLNADNVRGAVQTVRPAVVDVSSGVETEGRKDPAKIHAFVRAVNDASIGLPTSDAATPLVEMIDQIRDSYCSDHVNQAASARPGIN